MQKKLDFLLGKYDVGKKALLQEYSVVIDNTEIPLLPWRCERRFVELKNIVNNGTLVGVSTFRVCRIDTRGSDINMLLYREFDICQYIIGSKISEIMTFKNDNTANVLAKLENNVICTIEVAATLAVGTQPIDKHEIISQRGIACDRVVDTQVPQQSIYSYIDSNIPETYTDVDFELFGLEAEKVALVRQAFEAAKNPTLMDELKKDARGLKKLINLSDKSAEQTTNVKVGA